MDERENRRERLRASRAAACAITIATATSDDGNYINYAMN